MRPDKTTGLRKRLHWGLMLLTAAALTVVLLPGLARLRSGPTAAPDSERPKFSATPRGDASKPWRPTRPAVDATAAPGLADAAWPSEVGSPADGAELYDCLIEPNQVVDIGSPVRGRIAIMHVERSDFVFENQVLVEIDSGVERAQVELARARAEHDVNVKARATSLDLGERKVKRARRLFAKDALALDLRDDIETERRLARLELEQAREERRLAGLELQKAIEVLMRRIISSPISGVVLDRFMSPGEVVEDQNLLTVAEIDPLRVEVTLPASRFGSIEVGRRAAITPEFPSDTVHVASVSVVDRVIDPASGVFGVRLELPNPELRIPSGLHCQARFLPPD